MLTPKEKDDLFYVCSLIEYIARETCNYRKDIIKYFTPEVLKWQLRVADVNHCLSFEQVSDELIDTLNIKYGNFDSVKNCKYTVPSYISIGRVFQMLILNVDNGDIIQTTINVFSSFISDLIANFNSSLYYSNPDYLRCSYLEGKLCA
ncbi:MAG: hypothetical protein MJ211_11290 [Bacteroidales bacterium]|nr:hypothetical protein [Bacteroidales bacterium]